MFHSQNSHLMSPSEDPQTKPTQFRTEKKFYYFPKGGQNQKKTAVWGLPAQPPVASQMPTGSTAVTCQAQGYTWRRPLDRTTTESAHGHMIAHHHPYTQRRHPLLPLKESTHNKALLSPGDQVFVYCRLKHHEASTRQAAWPNLGTSGARKPLFWVISRRPQRGWRKHSMPAR